MINAPRDNRGDINNHKGIMNNASENDQKCFTWFCFYHLSCCSSSLFLVIWNPCLWNGSTQVSAKGSRDLEVPKLYELFIKRNQHHKKIYVSILCKYILCIWLFKKLILHLLLIIRSVLALTKFIPKNCIWLDYHCCDMLFW